MQFYANYFLTFPNTGTVKAWILNTIEQDPVLGVALLSHFFSEIILVAVYVKWFSSERYTWVRVFKNGPNKICGRQPYNKFEVHFKFFKGCLPQFLLGPFLNTLTHLYKEKKGTFITWLFVQIKSRLGV